MAIFIFFFITVVCSFYSELIVFLQSPQNLSSEKKLPDIITSILFLDNAIKYFSYNYRNISTLQYCNFVRI